MRIHKSLVVLILVASTVGCTSGWAPPVKSLGAFQPVRAKVYFAGLIYKGPFSVQELEEDSIREMEQSDSPAPRVPFGLFHEGWQEFKNQLRPRDQLFTYALPVDQMPGSKRSLEGVVAVRDGWVVLQFETRIR